MASADTTSPAPASVKRERDHLIHIVRGLAIWGVVTIHVVVQHINSDGRSAYPAPLGWEWVNWFLIWCVPWFVLTGGATSYWSTKRMWARATAGPDRRRATLQFVWRRMQRILIPYFAYVAIMAPTEILLGSLGFEGCSTFGLREALTWVVPFPHPDCLILPRWPLWFLMFYIPVSIAAPLLVWIFDRRWGRWLLIGVPTAIILLNDRLFYSLKGLDPFAPDSLKAVFTPATFLVGVLDILLGFIVFFAIGFLYAEGFLPQRRKLSGAVGAVLMVTTVLLMTAGPYTTGEQQFPLMAGYLFWGVGSFMILVGARDTVERLWRLPVVRPGLDWLSTKSYTIYIWHMTAIVAMWWTVYFVGLNGALYGLPLLAQHLVLYALCWLYIVPVVMLTYRFESWTIPPRWWTKRRARSTAPKVGAGVET